MKEIAKFLDGVVPSILPDYPFPVPILGTRHALCRGAVVDWRELAPPEEPVFGMAGFATYDDIINALSLGRRQFLNYAKTSFTVVSSLMYDYWLAAGMPTAGTFGTALTGRSLNSASTGAQPYTNPGATRNMHILSWGGLGTSSIGTVLLYDRVYEYPFNGTTTSASFTVPTLIARDVDGATAGDGLMMMVENFSTTGNAAVTLTPTYTNQAGTGSRTNAFTLVASGVSGKQLVNGNTGQFYVPLQAGDTGVRQVDSYTLSATATSTQMNIVLFRPIAYIPFFATNVWIERDLVLQLASLPRLYDNSALSFLLLTNTTSSGFQSTVTIAEN